MRNINLKLLTQREPVRLQTSATTFGELKEEIVKAGVSIDFSNAQFIERVTKAEFGHIDSALLPPGDILLYVVPVKTKLGANVDALSYKERDEKVVRVQYKGIICSGIQADYGNYLNCLVVKQIKVLK